MLVIEYDLCSSKQGKTPHGLAMGVMKLAAFIVGQNLRAFHKYRLQIREHQPALWNRMNKFIKDSKGSRQERARHYRLAKALRQFFQIQSIERPPKLNFCYPFGKNLLILAVLEIY